MFSLVTRDLFSKYRAITIAVLIFLAIDFGVMGTNFYNSYKISESAVSINLAGRQRMLAQRMAKTLLSMQDNVLRDRSQEADLKELALVVNLFDITLKGFQNGDTVPGGDGDPVFLRQVETEEAHRIVRDTYTLWTPYLEKLRPLLDSPDFTVAQLDEAVMYARSNNLRILGLMNDLTTDLEHIANQSAERLRLIQVVGLLAALIIALYTVLKSVSDLIRSDEMLVKAQKETKEILGTVKEGLFLLDGEYSIGAQYSKSLGDILEHEISPNMPFLPILESMVPKKVYNEAKDYIELLLENRVKEALVKSLNPLNQVEVRGEKGDEVRYLNFNFNRVFEGEKVSHLLVTVQDITNIVHLTDQLAEAKEQTRAEVEVLIKLLNTDTDMLRQFLDSVGRTLAQINDRLRSEEDSVRGRLLLVNYILRLVHGIKGEAAALGVEMFEAYAHNFEKELIEMRDHGNVNGENMVRITVLLDGFYEQLASISNIVERMSGITANSDQKYLQTFNDSLQNLVTRIAGDDQKEVQLHSHVEDLVKLPRPLAVELHSIAVQLLRNAIKHGIETPEERKALGKTAYGEIYIECKETTPGAYEFSVRDNGRGILFNKIKDSLVQGGYLSQEEVDRLDDRKIAMRLFDPGFSTASAADRDAGHGIGLDVVRQKIQALPGRLRLRSKAHVFTEFKARFVA